MIISSLKREGPMIDLHRLLKKKKKKKKKNHQTEIAHDPVVEESPAGAT
jgi:hypothetical protein